MDDTLTNRPAPSDAWVNGVSIIIPVYNALEELQQCIESLYWTTSSVPFEVIVVDNGSRSDVGDWLAAQRHERWDLRVLRFPEPLGFARAVNAGAAEARFHFLALLNSDTLAGGKWLDILAGTLSDDAGLGIVSPVTNRCGNPAQCDLAAQVLRPEETQRFAESIRGRLEVRNEPQRLVFFCVLLRRSLWMQLGGLDEAYRTGNYEDDDFCLRARMAGYRMAVIPGAFVFHHERKTFEGNGLNHGEWLARNQAHFAENASRWSRELRPPIPGRVRVNSLTVIVPVLPHRAAGLRDSLASLANQTVQDFEVLVVSAQGLDISPILNEFAGWLRIRAVTLEAADEELPAVVLNAALESAAGSEIAYLPASDIFYPFHLECLTVGMAAACTEAAYTAWNVAVGGPGGERRGNVMFPRAEPDIELGDWAPLVCWIHRKAAVSAFSFESSAGGFAPWLFLIRVRARVQVAYVCQATCERRPDPPVASDAADVDFVFHLFPTDDRWKRSQRQMFLEAVRLGNWEDHLIVSRNDRVRRVRGLLESQALGALTRRFQSRASAIEPVWLDSAQPDIFVFTTVEWASLVQRQHHFAGGLAARGHRVFWISVRLDPLERSNTANLITEVQRGLFEVRLPAPAADIYRMEWRPDVVDTWAAAFEYLRASYGISCAVQLVNYPRWQPICEALNERWGWRVVYDCLDDQMALGELFGHDMENFEARLMETSTAVVVSSSTLLAAARLNRPDALLVPNGADFEIFRSARPEGVLADLAQPVVGFFGAFADWLDFDWIDAAAERFPQWSFVYIGRENFARTTTAARWKLATSRANVHVFPQMEQRALARCLAEFDVCIMPFRDLRVTRSMSAVKLFEYLAAGKPVVAADLPETRPLRNAGLIAIYGSFEESCELLEEAVRSGMSPEKVQRRIEFAALNTWEHRLEALSQVIGSAAQTGFSSFIQPTRV